MVLLLNVTDQNVSVTFSKKLPNLTFTKRKNVKKPQHFKQPNLIIIASRGVFTSVSEAQSTHI
jgi:hypothetical protein